MLMTPQMTSSMTAQRFKWKEAESRLDAKVGRNLFKTAVDGGDRRRIGELCAAMYRVYDCERG